MGYLVEFGARPLKRKAVSGALGLLAETILSGIIRAGCAVMLSAKDGRLTAERVE